MASAPSNYSHRYPADFVANGPSVDYLEMQFIRRDYTADNTRYFPEPSLSKILINIPQKVTEAMSQQFNQSQLGELGRFLGNRGGAVQATTDSVRRLLENFGLDKAVELSNKLGASGLSAGGLLSATSGVVFNPNLEVLYEGPDFRRFNFQFNLFTKSKEDAEAIYNIVETLRAASLPLGTGTTDNTALTNVFLDAAQTQGVVDTVNAAGDLIKGAVGDLLNPNFNKSKTGSKFQNAAGALGKSLKTNGIPAVLNAFSGAGQLGVVGASAATGTIFNDKQRFITQPPFILLTYRRGSEEHPFIRPLLPAAIDQINFDFTPTGNYTTVGDFNATERATTVGVTITMQLTEVTNLFADKLFTDRAPGVL